MRTPFVARRLAPYLAWLAVACDARPAARPPPPPSPAVALPAAPGPASAPGAPPAPGGPRPPPLLQAEATSAGGGTPLARDGIATVDPGAGFRVEVAADLRDARLSLLDGQDAVVEAAGTAEVGAVSRFSLVPSRPLRPGSPYQLRLEGVRASEMHDARGGGYQPVAWGIRAAGDPPPTPRGKRARRRR